MKTRLADALWQNGRLSLRHLLDSRREAWVLAWLLGMATAIATIGLLALSGWFITAAGLAGMVSLGSAFTFNYFGPAAIIRLFAIVRTAGRYGERLASHNAVLALLADLRSSLFARLAATPSAQTASMRQMHRLTSDIDLLNAWPLSVVLPWLWAVVMLLVIVLVAALAGGVGLALWILLPLLLATAVLPSWAGRHGQAWANHQTEEAEQRRLALLRPLSALTALLQWRQWGRFEADFRRQDARYVSGLLQQQQMSGAVVLAQQLCLVVAWGILLWQGGLAVSAHNMSVAMLLALLLALFGFSELVLVLGMQMTAYGLSKAACTRLNALVPHETEIANTAPRQLPQALHLQAHHLSARLPSALNGVEQVDFDLENGDILVVTGPSGAGKSTLLSVLAGELEPLSGSLMVNQQSYAYWDWQGKIAYLAQQLDIFDLTLSQNLRLGKHDATEEELWSVLVQVGLADWAQTQPLGLETPLGEYGSAVSGGQARRIALARLLLKPYPLMLLDEPFAGLDAATIGLVASALESHQQHGILVVVSHQVSPWQKSKQVNIDLAHVNFNETIHS